MIVEPDIEFKNIETDEEIIDIIKQVIYKCYEIENLNSNISITIILTEETYIQELNKKFRNIDKPTDVLSFPMFEKEEIEDLIKNDIYEKVLGDIVISIPRVHEQAKEYEHSFTRELSYMLVHGFYHLMGYDHMEETDKKVMRAKEENILSKIQINK